MFLSADKAESSTYHVCYTLFCSSMSPLSFCISLWWILLLQAFSLCCSWWLIQLSHWLTPILLLISLSGRPFAMGESHYTIEPSVTATSLQLSGFFVPNMRRVLLKPPYNGYLSTRTTSLQRPENICLKVAVEEMFDCTAFISQRRVITHSLSFVESVGFFPARFSLINILYCMPLELLSALGVFLTFLQ